MIRGAGETLLLTWAASVSFIASAEELPHRFVEGNDLISTTLPAIRVRVAPPFHFVGSFHFTIRDIAEGDRYVFIDAEQRRVKRMFIAQFEGFLPRNKETYRYSFRDALDLGGHRFKHNTFAFSIRADERENPKNEGVLTAKFLQQKGYAVDDELMSSRFVTVPDKERRHELILFYVENVRDAASTLKDLYENDKPTAILNRLGKELTERSQRAFKVVR